MAKRRPPTLPSERTRGRIHAYLVELVEYAEAEFGRGRSDVEVWSDVRAAGTIPKARMAVRNAYLDHVGVPRFTRILAKGIGVGTSMGVYWRLSTMPHANSTSSFIWAMVVAICLGVTIEIALTKLARARFISKNRAKA